MPHRSTTDILFSIFFGLIILFTELGISLLATLLYILYKTKRWATIQIRIISGRMKNSLRMECCPRHHSVGPNRAHINGQFSTSHDRPFANLRPHHFLQTHPGSPEQSRVMRPEAGTTPCRPSASRPPRQPRRRLVTRSPSPPSATPPPPYCPSMAVLPPGLPSQTLAESMDTAAMVNMTDMTSQAMPITDQSETTHSLSIAQSDQSGAEVPIPLSPMATTPPPFDPLEKEE